MKKFYSDHHIPTVTMLWLIVVFLIATPFFTPNQIWGEMFIPIIIVALCAIFILWILLDTKYVIKNSFLHYTSGPIRGKIDIYKINAIAHQKKWFVQSSLKPALGSKGLIIKYGKFDDIYISPKRKQEFIEALLEINPHIEIE